MQVLAINSTNYNMNYYVTSSGGQKVESANYKTDTIIGTISGNTNSSNYKNYLGFFFGGGGNSISEQINYPPIINDISNIPDQSIIEAGIKYVNFSVLASDLNGVNDLNHSTLNSSFSLTGEATRINSSCTFIEVINSTTANYSCSIGIWYFDAANTWNVSAQVKDLKGNISSVYQETFNIQSTTSINLSTISLSFSGVNVGSKNKTANNNITLQNIGNKVLSINVNASNLDGQTTTSEFIPATNFSIHNNGNGCDGTSLSTGIFVTLQGITLNRGNISKGDGTQNLVTCLRELPLTISAQSYSTNISKPWVISVS